MSNQNTIFGIKLTNINISNLIEQIIICLSEKKAILIVNYLNVHAVSLAKKNHVFREALNQSDIVFCDGFGIKVAAKILGANVGERMTPPDWIDDLFKVAEQKSYNLYFLGDEDEVIQKFVKAIKIKYPKLIIAGFHHGFFHQDIKLSEQIVKDISANMIDVLIVGMGMPLQETWINKNKNYLNARVIISVGALYRWYTHTEKRGPKLLTDNGFEWLTRLVMYPRKVWKRYVFELPYFLVLVLFEKIRITISNKKSYTDNKILHGDSILNIKEEKD